MEDTPIHTEKITLQCIKEKNKLRIRFHSFTNFEGKEFTNAYNNQYNCQFPKDIRKEGQFYEVNGNDIQLIARPNSKPFYKIRTDHLRIISGSPPTVSEIYEVNECVICMSSSPDQIFAPCGHLCTCLECCIQLRRQRAKNNCPLCRRNIEDVIAK